jgi:hypothetical protein
MGKILVYSSELQHKILDCITSDEIDKFFNATIFASSSESQACKQAMIHGMVIAGMMTSRCELFDDYYKGAKDFIEWLLTNDKYAACTIDTDEACILCDVGLTKDMWTESVDEVFEEFTEYFIKTNLQEAKL